MMREPQILTEPQIPTLAQYYQWIAGIEDDELAKYPW
jgi:hypothetical protein